MGNMAYQQTSCLFFSFFLGHLTGKHERHFAVSGCPLYHNLSADECKVIIINHVQNTLQYYVNLLYLYSY